METALGKIGSVKIGMCGHNGGMFGVEFLLLYEGNQIVDFDGLFIPEDISGLTDEHTEKTYRIMEHLHRIMSQAECSNANELIGLPIEMEFKDGFLFNWRILTEVL